MMPLPDRLELLRSQTELTGIDFVYVHDDQLRIDVFFHVEPNTLDVPLVNDLAAADVRIEAPHAPHLQRVPASALSWPVVAGRRPLRIDVAEPGDFVIYRLTIDDSRLDDHFNGVPLDFKAACPHGLDCAPDDPCCPPPEGWAPAVDYTARDFWNLRRAMLDMASLRLPDWEDRYEADAAVMLTEVLAAVGDGLAYTQDRIRWESTLPTATQRRSLRRHALLVDHRIHDGLGGSTWLAVTAAGPGPAVVPAGTLVWAETEDRRRIEFSVGAGLADEVDGVTFGIDARRNALTPHIPDAGDACLPAGSTELAVAGHAGVAFPDPGDPIQWVALYAEPDDPSLPVKAWVVAVTSGVDDDDPLIDDPAGGGPPAPITVLQWGEEHATPFDIDLTATVVLGNLVPATAGRTASTTFGIGPAAAAEPAIERDGPVTRDPDGDPVRSTRYLHTLPDPAGLGLVWRPAEELPAPSGQGSSWRPEVGKIGQADADPRVAAPELVVLEDRSPDPPVTWEWRPTLVGPTSSTPDDRHVTLDDGTWGPAVTYRLPGDEFVHNDLVSGAGHTIRFGDGEFGSPPPAGAVFEARYRLGNGPDTNVPAGAISHADPAVAAIAAVTNPLPVVDGRARETADEVRRVAPYEWQAVAYRAVRSEDYAEAVERLAWVQRAGATARWTGSWLGILATPDPRDAQVLADELRRDGDRQLDRFRQAARDAWTVEPTYADLDLDISLCALPAHYPGDVKERVMVALVGDPTCPGDPYFFDPDNFVFGTPLLRAHLEAAIQAVDGVLAVEAIQIRRRGHFDWRPFTELVYTVAPDEVVRVANDPAHPERGSVRLTVRGGA